MNSRLRALASIAAAALTALTLASCSSTTTPLAGHTTTSRGSGATGTTVRGAAGSSTTIAGSGGGNTGGGTTTTAPPAGSPVVTPSAMSAIVSADSAANNLANSQLSTSLQDQHETCLQAIADDITYAELRSSGTATSEPAFTSTSTTPFVAKQTGYPAYASSVVTEKSAGNQASEAFFTFVKMSASAPWKLDAAPDILGATPPGFKVPSPATDSRGFAQVVPAGSARGLVMAPVDVVHTVAGAFTAETPTGHFPSGVTAVFGPQGGGDPNQAYQAWVGQQGGSFSDVFSATPPAVARPGMPSTSCPLPAYALSGGGAIVTFAVFETIIIKQGPSPIVQPASRQLLGSFVAPGSYAEVTFHTIDIDCAIIPAAGSGKPVNVIGQESETISASTVPSGGVLA